VRYIELVGEHVSRRVYPCRCGRQIYYKGGYVYNADYAKDYPGDVLLHGCQYFKHSRTVDPSTADSVKGMFTERG
jgi:hypothetical protein